VANVQLSETPEHFFVEPGEERTKQFLSAIL
jgi:ABC-type polar amino acid transport system ATPase subunit